MPCPPMDGVRVKDQGKGGGKTVSSGEEAGTMKPSSHSRMTLRLYYFPSSSSGESRGQPAAAVAAEGKSGDNQSDNGRGGGGNGKKKKKRWSISISQRMSVACAAGSICSTKESSVTSRRRGSCGATSSCRSLKAAPDDDAAAISATSSFNSAATTTTATVTTTTSSSSPPSSSSSFGGSFRSAQQIRKLSGGCYDYDYRSVLDPTRSLAPTPAVFPCADCDEVFVKAESLELHRATRHGVSELGPEDTSRNIVEIIFQSSWPRRRKKNPSPKIERVLKVRSSYGTVKRFEQYKESVKEKASSSTTTTSNDGGKKTNNNARCVADGNELLRFYCTTFTCALGCARGGDGTVLCRAPPSQCKLCGIIRDGFRLDDDEAGGRIGTTATSGRAHDAAPEPADGERKAMLVCRVVAGRVNKKGGTDDDGDYDSVSVGPCSDSDGAAGSDSDQLFVFNPRAILPCFVVVYSGY